MGMCLPFSNMFKLAGLVFSLKAFRLNSLSLCKRSILKPLSLYMLLTVLNSLMMLSALFEVKFSAVSKVILDYFVWRKCIPLI